MTGEASYPSSVTRKTLTFGVHNEVKDAWLAPGKYLTASDTSNSFDKKSFSNISPSVFLTATIRLLEPNNASSY